MKRATYAEPTLALFPDEEDVELPLDDEAARIDAVVEAGDGAVRNELLGLESLTSDYRVALDDLIDHLEAGTTPPANRLRRYRTLAGRPAVVDQPATPTARRDEGIARAAAKWTEEESALVDLAIVSVRNTVVRLYDHDGRTDTSLLEFTTADVWRQLNGTVPVTKGIAGRMLAAKAAGIIANTGRTVIAPQESTGPNHGQRLTVWRAL